jgi:hypothetical protein
MKINIAIFLVAAFAFGSCKSNSTSSSSNNNNNNGGGGSVPSTPNTMVFTANGTTYTDTCYAVQTTASGISNITVGGGSGSPDQGLGFSLINESAVGTSYNVGPISINGSSTSYATMEYSFNNKSGDSGSYSSPIAGTSSVGTITITSLSATNIQATFNGTLTLLKGNGPSTITITNGGVNATIE